MYQHPDTDSHRQFLTEIRRLIPKGLLYTDPTRRLAWGTDAGIYRLIPQLVVQSTSEKQIAELMLLAPQYGKTLTFRAAGTSLSGQAISDSILVIAGQHWEKHQLSADAHTIRLQPGIVGQHVNHILKPFGKKFPPDPASLKSAMVGGIVQNNASGMSCGIHENSYRMIRSARLILADGTVLDTGDKASCEDFRNTHPEFITKIEQLRDSVRSDSILSERIRKKYSIKNVTGLSINALIDFDDPFEIITRLIVGSEGTLAFLAEVTMQTVDLKPFSASAMLYFPTLRSACEAVVALKSHPVSAAELFDRAAIRSVEDKPDALSELRQLPDDGAVMLLKTEALSQEELNRNIASVSAELSRFPLLHAPVFTDKEEEYSPYWTMRSGIFPTVGSTRPTGTTCIIEDVAFQLNDLPQAIADLREVLLQHGYGDAVLYGHALEGNFHFILNQLFDKRSEIERYDRLMKAVADLVVDVYDGSLKAEHGTGRNMAPFVRKEWGDKAWEIMKSIKHLFDPGGILNPGVIFNDDPHCHLKNLKALPATHPLIDQCIECGFCEINCVSSGFTLSARQRIVVQREIKRLGTTGEDAETLQLLEKEYDYAGNRSCAGDGLCAIACPVGINTGEYIHHLRHEQVRNSHLAMAAGSFTASHLHWMAGGVKTLLGTAYAVRSLTGKGIMKGMTRGLRWICGNTIPLWTPSLPAPAHGWHTLLRIAEGYNRALKLRESEIPLLKVVYFPSCLNQMMGSSKGDPELVPLAEKMISLLHKAGYEVLFPEAMNRLCCGTIWESKGMPDIADQKSDELERALLEASNQGEYPVLCDQSPCLYRMGKKIQGLRLFEPVEFIENFLVDRLEFEPVEEAISVFATCSTRKMQLDPVLVKLASRCSKRVLVPAELACCGFAGDKGFTMPELNEHGLRKLRPQLEKAGIIAGYSNSRTCEIGLSTHSGVPWMSIVYLVDRCTRKKRDQVT